MADDKKKILDIDGYDIITGALLDLLNEYPALQKGQEITFATLEDDSGTAMFPDAAAAVERETSDILGDVMQECAYKMMIVYRASGLPEGRKIAVKEWLDNLGRWLEQQTVTVNGSRHKLSSYPPLTDGRTFKTVTRDSPAWLDSVNENKSENWCISITARYTNEFYR